MKKISSTFVINSKKFNFLQANKWKPQSRYFIQIMLLNKCFKEGYKSYPSRLLFAFNNKRPLHVVCSYNIEEELIIIVTVYEPTTEFWETDFKTRKTK